MRFDGNSLREKVNLQKKKIVFIAGKLFLTYTTVY